MQRRSYICAFCDFSLTFGRGRLGSWSVARYYICHLGLLNFIKTSPPKGGEVMLVENTIFGIPLGGQAMHLCFFTFGSKYKVDTCFNSTAPIHTQLFRTIAFPLNVPCYMLVVGLTAHSPLLVGPITMEDCQYPPPWFLSTLQ